MVIQKQPGCCVLHKDPDDKGDFSMTGIIAVLIVIAAVFFILFSEQRQKNRMEEALKAAIGSEQFVYGSMASLAESSRSVRGYFALTDQALYFMEAAKNSVRLRLEYSEILSHKLYFSVFIEAADHTIYEIKAANNAAAYRAFTKQYEKTQ